MVPRCNKDIRNTETMSCSLLILLHALCNKTRCALTEISYNTQVIRFFILFTDNCYNKKYPIHKIIELKLLNKLGQDLSLLSLIVLPRSNFFHILPSQNKNNGIIILIRTVTCLILSDKIPYFTVRYQN